MKYKLVKCYEGFTYYKIIKKSIFGFWYNPFHAVGMFEEVDRDIALAIVEKLNE